MPEFLDWYQQVQNAVQRMNEQCIAEEEASQPKGRRASKVASKMTGTRLSASGSRSGGSRMLDLTALSAPLGIQSRYDKLAAHTFVQVLSKHLVILSMHVYISLEVGCYQFTSNMLGAVQVIGRNILHRAWIIFAVTRGLPQPLPRSVLEDMVMQPFIACVREALGAFLAAPSKNLPAFVVEIERDHPQRMFRRLYDAQFTHGGTTFLRTRHYSVLRILSTIYADCTDFLACLEDLIFQMQCKCPRLQCAPGDYLDHEFHMRAREIQSLVSRYVHRAVWVCLSTGACIIAVPNTI